MKSALPLLPALLLAACSGSAPDPAPRTAIEPRPAGVATTPTVPDILVGIWAADRHHCRPGSDTRMVIAPRQIDFEGRGVPVRSAAILPDGVVSIEYDVGGTRQTGYEDFHLSAAGGEVRRVTDGRPDTQYTRCLTKGMK